MHSAGKYIIIAGAIIVLVGIILYFFGNKLSWLGHLPGDLRITKGHVKIYIPITTMVLISLLITILLNIIRRLF